MPVREKQTYRFGHFELDVQCGQLRRDGVGLKLQGQPVQILEILLEHPGQLVTRDELRKRLWASDTFVDFDHSLNAAIKRLRHSLGDEADTPRYIETLPRRGYRFIGEMPSEQGLQKDTGTGPLGEDITSNVATTLADAAITETDSGRRARRSLWIIAFLMALAAMGAATYWSTRPLPLPKIVNAHALTKTGYRKTLAPWLARSQARLVTDGLNVYFQEYRPAGLATLQVNIGGGEPTLVAISKQDFGSLRDISSNGSSLLLSAVDPQTHGWDTWVQPLPTGPARLILKDARWPLWTPDAKSILFARNNDHDLYRANANGTDARRLATLPDITWPEISPDGRRIRFAVDPKYDLWEAAADGSSPHPILRENTGGLAGTWSPDGKYFFFSQGRDRNDLWVLPEKRPWQRGARNPIRLTVGPMSIGAPTSSNDGRKLFAVAEERHGELSILDRKSGDFVRYLDGIPACYVDFSRDGKWIVYVSYPEGTLWRSRIDGSDRMQLTSSPLTAINPRWSPDRKLVAFTGVSNDDESKASNRQRMYVVSADGGAPVLLLAGPFGDPTWSPDGRYLAYAYTPSGTETEVRVLDLRTQLSAAIPGSQGFWSPRWSPDGKYLVALSNVPAKLGLFSFATQGWETLQDGFFGWPAWSHDNKFVYALNWEARSLVRFSVADQKPEQIAALKGFRSTAFLYWAAGWYGLTPDDRPITTRDTGIEEIYAFDLEYK